MVSAIWENVRPKALELVATLQEAGAAALDGHLHAELRSRAGDEAHKLGGSLGSFGFWAASRRAREAEVLLAPARALYPWEAARLQTLACELQQDLGSDPDPGRR